MTDPVTEIPIPPGLPEPVLEPSTEVLITGAPGGKPAIGLAIKRTYRLGPRGGWRPVPEAEQETVVEDELEYYEAEPPFCAPISHGADVMFRPLTDIVVQGSAWATAGPVRRTTVGLRIESLRRDITVHGDRRVERGPTGDLRFTEGEPFESMPLRYDRAYGGMDLYAYLTNRVPLIEDLARARPDLPYAQASRYHYPRNPSGLGFVLDTAPYDQDDLLVPNLEFGFDPVTPDRLAVGRPDLWPMAPLPAGMDWSSGGWFPRQSYLGVHDLPTGFAGRVREQELGWAPEDLLSIATRTTAPDVPVRPAYAQGASPGMSIPIAVDRVREGIPVKLVHLHRERPELRMVLPREWPVARLDLGGPSKTELTPALSAVVMRPDEDEVVMLWCAHAPRDDDYSPAQYQSMTHDVSWRRDRR